MRCLLLDIEGTVSPIAFVKQTLFPYASKALPAFIQSHAEDDQVRHWLQLAAADMPGQPDDQAIVSELQRWIAADRKHTALKALQGMIWERGYANGEYQAPIYADAVEFMRSWHRLGKTIAIYSSGSVAAQKLLFRYSDAGDLNALLQHYFDTEVGAKQDPDSYRNIITALAIPAAQITFCSDVVAELDAAHQVGIYTVLVDRPQDYPQPRQLADDSPQQRIASFAQLAGVLNTVSKA
ncbi:MAG: acireductone synthase [Gammaproteobacteria bacterium]|jgi:enolase-phosphatase E1|nr:acireductone synthase [Gammaproteobacteria bacterium]